MRAALVTGACSGLLAGAGIGLIESLVVLTHAALPPETAALAVGPALYGLIGAALGLVAGPVAALLVRGRDPYALAAVLVADLVVVLVEAQGRELPGEHPMSWAAVAASLLVADLVALLLLPTFLLRSPLGVVRRPRGAVGTWLAVLLLSTVFSLLPGGTRPGTLAPEREVPPGLALRPNILVLAVEGMRADTLDPEVMPRLAARLPEAVVYEAAFSPTSWTRPAVASLLTSLVPTSHGVLAADEPLADAATTLPEVLAGQGYVTAALANGLHFSRSANLQQGFDWFAWMPVRESPWARESVLGLRLVGAVKGWLLRLGLLEVGPHGAYLPADGVLAAARDVLEEVGDARWFLLVHLADLRPPWFHAPPGVSPVARETDPWPDPSRRPEILQAWRGEVAWLDEELGGFFDWLDERGLRRDTAVVLVGLSGTSLGEHGAWWTGSTLYDEAIAVPLALWLPPGGRGGRHAEQVRLVDLAPTLARMGGAPIPPGWAGEPLPLPEGEGDHGERPVYAETDLPRRTLSAIRAGGWKYIRGQSGEVELYHVAEDPAERVDLARRAGRVQADLDQLLRRAQQAAVRSSLAGSGGAIFDPATRERLRELGYVE